MILSALICFFLAASEITAGRGQTEQNSGAEQENLSSLKKSLIIPGWGQLAEKRYLEGFAFAAADVYCLYQVIRNNHRGNQYYRLYQNAASVADAQKYRELTEKYDTRRNQFILASVGVWIINLVDIYVIIRSKTNNKNRLRIGFESTQNHYMAVRLDFRF